jgi:hypothetical protein
LVSALVGVLARDLHRIETALSSVAANLITLDPARHHGTR